MVNQPIRLVIPPKGYILRRFLELATIYLMGVKVEGDELVITNCMDFHLSLKNLLNEMGNKDIFLTGNDRRYVISKISNLLGIDTSSKVTATDILKALLRVIEDKIRSECITNALLNTKLALLNLFKANFYEYGKTYLAKPNDRYVLVDEAPIITQLLGIVGVLIADVGSIRDVGIHYYLLPPEGISLNMPSIRHEDIIKRFNYARKVLTRYFSAPKSLLVLKLATELASEGYRFDDVAAELVAIQEGGKRATIISTEPISTEGLVQVIHSVGDEYSAELSTKLGILADIAITSLGSEDGGSIANLIVRIASDLLTYARTKSLDCLYSATSLISRLSASIRRGTKGFEFLRNTLLDRGIENPSEWLSRLASLMSMLVK